MSNQRETPAGRSGPAQKTSALEWMVAAIGLAVVVGAAVYMTVYAARGADGPPLLSVRTVSVVPMGSSSHVVRFEARNDGGATAASVHLSAELRSGNEVVETARATLDYLPRNSRRGGAFVFSRDPGELTLSLRVEGYSEP